MNLNTMLEDHIPAALCFQLLLDAFNIATTITPCSTTS